MQESESLPGPTLGLPSRLVLHDRGPWIFALYWHSFQYHLGDEPPKRAMGLFGLSAELRAVLLENQQAAPLVRRFDARLRFLMAVCSVPGLLSLMAFTVLYNLPQYVMQALFDRWPMMVAVLTVLSLLMLALMAILTRGPYRLLKELFEVYNGSDRATQSATP